MQFAVEDERMSPGVSFTRLDSSLGFVNVYLSFRQRVEIEAEISVLDCGAEVKKIIVHGSDTTGDQMTFSEEEAVCGSISETMLEKIAFFVFSPRKHKLRFNFQAATTIAGQDFQRSM